ncbi:M1 family metallopeptidase [Flavobacteriaceae bacterium 14752]|uniref:M1 family metallopeptidase n=1 Tax=Mesohalobacter salilacus TaxID=2491711 RepID=UPI000F63423B|nr:M1 family peptidase [Flavobacteriaceae bacterium 14752]
MIRLVFIGIFICFSSIIAQTHNFDVHKISAEITPNLENESVSGELSFSFNTSQDTDSIFLDAKNMAAQIMGSDIKVSLNISEDKLWFVGDFEVDETYNINFSYQAQPKQTLYFVGFEDDAKTNDQVFTQGQGKYTSHWLPSIDDMNDKIEFDLSIIVPKFYGALANGKLIEQWKENDSLSRWTYDMKKPMSSYLVAISVGDYKREIQQSNSGVDLHQYLLKKDSLYLEPTYRHTKQIFDYLENKIGVDYPWQNYKQVPVRDFLYAGMENTSLTIFSDAFVVDSIGYFDRNYVNVNAHELAHQWFGNLITETESKHHWLHEGFATYYALLAERQIFGDNYFYHKLYQYAESLKSASDNGKGEKLLKPNASSLTYYQKGAWALFMLNQIVGEDVFDRAVQIFLNKYAFQNVTTDDFMNEVKALTNVDLSDFEQQWFKQSAFQAEQALEALETSLFIPEYFELIAKRPLDISKKIGAIETAFDFPINIYIAQEAVSQLASEPANDEVIQLYQSAFNTGNLWVRQAISESLTEIPLALKSAYETLLQDQSYQTRENAFLHLWMNFPKDRKRYLNQMQNQDGFRDKNLKQLWLTLNLATPDFQADKTTQTYQELAQYTSPKYRFQIREHAFGYLYQIDAFSDQVLINLLDGCFHHTWRFRDFCRQLLKTLLKNPTYQSQINNLKPKLNDKALTYLNKIQ